MEKLTLLFEEFLLKMIIMTERFISCDLSQNVNLDDFTGNRDRLLQIIEKLSMQISWEEVPEEKRVELNRQIDFIKKLDEKLLVKLQEYQQEVKREIEVTVKNKDQIKGYNLNDVK